MYFEVEAIQYCPENAIVVEEAKLGTIQAPTREDAEDVIVALLAYQACVCFRLTASIYGTVPNRALNLTNRTGRYFRQETARAAEEAAVAMATERGWIK